MKLGNWDVRPDRGEPDGQVLYMFAGTVDGHGGFPRYAALFADHDGVALLLHVRGESTIAHDVGDTDITMDRAVFLAYDLLDGDAGARPRLAESVVE